MNVSGFFLILVNTRKYHICSRFVSSVLQGDFREENFNTAMTVLKDAGDAAKGDQRGRKGGFKRELMMIVLCFLFWYICYLCWLTLFLTLVYFVWSILL